MDTRTRRALETANGAPLRYAPGRAIPSTCRHCGRTVLAGWDDTTMAVWTILDPVALTPTQEAACWLHLNTPTWEVFGHPGAYRFGRTRTAPWMHTIHTPTPIGKVMPVHKCTPPPGTQWVPVRPPGKTKYPDHPPF